MDSFSGRRLRQGSRVARGESNRYQTSEQVRYLQSRKSHDLKTEDLNSGRDYRDLEKRGLLSDAAYSCVA